MEFTPEWIQSWRNVISYENNNMGYLTTYQELVLDCLDEISRLQARVQELEAKYLEHEHFHPRAMKLLDKKKNFLVVAEDEPYFLDVYKMIRSNEKKIGRWNEVDERDYLLCGKRIEYKDGE